MASDVDTEDNSRAKLREGEPVALRRVTRQVLRRLFQDRERFDLWSGLTFFTCSLLLFIAGWTVGQDTWVTWLAVPSALLASLGLLGLSGKAPLSGLILNRGFVNYEPKRGGQMAVAYGAALFGLGVFGLSSLPYAWLEPSGSYGLAALLGASLILGGLYIVASTPVLEPSAAAFETDELLPGEPVPWYVVEDSELAPEKPAEPLMPKNVEPRYAVPQVRHASAAKRPSMLKTEDIVAYAFIECDWVETPANYTCVTVEGDGMAPVIEAGDIVGINHAMTEPDWLRGKLVAAFTDEHTVALGFLQEFREAGGGATDASGRKRWRLAPRNDRYAPQEVQPVALIGVVEWSLKPGSKSIQPADVRLRHSTEHRIDG